MIIPTTLSNRQYTSAYVFGSSNVAIGVEGNELKVFRNIRWQSKNSLNYQISP